MPPSILRLDPRLERRLTAKKAQLDQYRPLPPDTVARLNADLRVFLTYHSNALEGNTLTLQETQIAIEYGMTTHGHPLREFLEATNHAEAYTLVTTLATERVPITRETILSLHSLVMSKILDTAGQFRRVPVYIRGSNMTPPPVDQVEALMQEWVTWLDGDGQRYHPVVRAAIAHHGFEAVHPFTDGNGRVGRLLLNLTLMRVGYPPALVLRDRRVSYLEALNRANTGNYAPLANLLGQAVEAGLDRYLEACVVPAMLGLVPLHELAQATGYSVDYLGWLIRKGRLAARKQDGRWHSSLEAIKRYQHEVAVGLAKRGRPKKVRPED
ncbi:MAG: Fic family protein [Herpetosiphonaceae bacterium]|nr:Fic family protein [Herpetosiphonaceae bacterium]